MKRVSVFTRRAALTVALAMTAAFVLRPALAANAVGGAPVDDISRIVSIGGAVTEILYALGFDKNIVGIDSTSLYPPRAAAEKPNVGYMRQLSAEGVLGLNPSLILAVEGSGPKETMAVLEAAHVPLINVPDHYSGEGIVQKINIIAHAVGAEHRARCLVDNVRNDLTALARITAGIGTKRRILFVLSFVNGRAMASGHDTAADGIIKLAGGINAIDGYNGYKMLTDEAVIAAKPDVILSMQRGGPGVLTADGVFANAAFSATPAAKARSFIAMDGLYLLGFGPRTVRAARDLAVALYPDLTSQPFPSERQPGEGPCHE